MEHQTKTKLKSIVKSTNEISDIEILTNASTMPVSIDTPTTPSIPQVPNESNAITTANYTPS